MRSPDLCVVGDNFQTDVLLHTFFFFSDSEQVLAHLLYSFLAREQRSKLIFSVSCFCKAKVSVLLIELKGLYKLT